MPAPSRLTIDLDPAVSARLTALADRDGKDPAELVATALASFVEVDVAHVARVKAALCELDLSDRDYAHFLFESLDMEAQLLAIRDLLKRNRRADEELRQEITELSIRARQLTGLANEHTIYTQIDHIHQSIYQDAAHSMAAAGMLAPLFEAMFVNIFCAIKEEYFKSTVILLKHTREQYYTAEFWDCHFVFEKHGRRKDIVAGIRQLAEASGLASFLPNNYLDTIKALFLYRNKMFHWGFEWPPVVRSRLQEELDKAPWPRDWFKCSTTNNQPWIFYLSETFIEHCILELESILDGIGRFARSKLEERITR